PADNPCKYCTPMPLRAQPGSQLLDSSCSFSRGNSYPIQRTFQTSDYLIRPDPHVRGISSSAWVLVFSPLAPRELHFLPLAPQSCALAQRAFFPLRLPSQLSLSPVPRLRRAPCDVRVRLQNLVRAVSTPPRPLLSPRSLLCSFDATSPPRNTLVATSCRA